MLLIETNLDEPVLLSPAVTLVLQTECFGQVMNNFPNFPPDESREIHMIFSQHFPLIFEIGQHLSRPLLYFDHVFFGFLPVGV